MVKRLFVAINLPAEVKLDVERVINQLRAVNRDPEIKFINPTLAHLTLHFLGDVDAGQIAVLEKSIAQTCRHHRATSLVSKKIDAFPNLKLPRVLYLECANPDQAIFKIYQDLFDPISAIGVTLVERPWQPHLTLARIKVPKPITLTGVTITPWRINITSIELMQSTLTPRGPQYQLIKSFNLQPYA